MQLTHLSYGGSRHQMMFKMKETIERQLVEQTIRQRTRGAIPCRFACSISSEYQSETPSQYRQGGPEEQHRPQHPAHQTKGKETIDTSREDQVIGQ